MSFPLKAVILFAALAAAGLVLYGQAYEPKPPIMLNEIELERAREGISPEAYAKGRRVIEDQKAAGY